MNPLRRIGWRFYYSFRGYWMSKSLWIVWIVATLSVPLAVLIKNGMLSALAMWVSLVITDMGLSNIFESKRKLEILVSIYTEDKLEKMEGSI